jgi:hypothetical protein
MALATRRSPRRQALACPAPAHGTSSTHYGVSLPSPRATQSCPRHISGARSQEANRIGRCCLLSSDRAAGSFIAEHPRPPVRKRRRCRVHTPLRGRGSALAPPADRSLGLPRAVSAGWRRRGADRCRTGSRRPVGRSAPGCAAALAVDAQPHLGPRRSVRTSPRASSSPSSTRSARPASEFTEPVGFTRTRR